MVLTACSFLPQPPEAAAWGCAAGNQNEASQVSLAETDLNLVATACKKVRRAMSQPPSCSTAPGRTGLVADSLGPRTPDMFVRSTAAGTAAGLTRICL